MARQLDIDDEIRNSLASYIETELTNHRAERGKLEDRWIAEQQDFWAEPSDGVESIPAIGFASLIVPITAIAVEAIHARDMGQMFALKELITVDVAEDQESAKNGLEKFFNHELLNVMNFREKIEPILLQITKHGTGIGTVEYRESKTHVVVKRDVNGKEAEIKVPVYREKGTVIDGIPVNDFLMPFYVTDAQDAPWIGHQFRASEYTVKQMVASGYLGPDAYDTLAGYYQSSETGTDRVLTDSRQLSDVTPVWPSELTLCRLVLDYDIDDNGEESLIEVIYHELSRQILSIKYTDEKNYEKGVYMPQEYKWYGYGVAKQNHEFQVEVTTQHRQRLDNATIANMAMFKVKKSAAHLVKDDEPIFPGKKWFVEEMNDIEPMFIGDVKASAYNNENQVIIYSQQRTGVNELTLGMPNVGTPGTASDSLARVQESNRKFDYNYNNKKDFANRLVYRAAQSILRFGPSDKQVFSILANGSAVELFFRQEQEKLKNKLFFNIQLAGAKNNKILDRQNLTQLTGMVTQYWTQSLALAQQLQDPMLVQDMTKKALKSADQIMLEILRAFDVPNPEKLIYNFDAYKPSAPPSPLPLQAGAEGSSSPNGPSGGNITSIVAPNARIDQPNILAPGGFPNASLPFAG
jgi:hypothetical protein